MENNLIQGFKRFSRFVTLSHSVFALPFAGIGFALAIHEQPHLFTWWRLVLMVLCMVSARTAAMSFNRWIDRRWDALNQRTQHREIPSGQISPGAALRITLLFSLLFIIFSFGLNRLCFYLSPLALCIILGYSYTKRFTSWCHIILGLGLGLAPIGAYLSVSGSFNSLPLYLSLLVLFWVSGFDILYALQDEAFDRSVHLHSIPVRLGGSGAILLSRILHACAGLLIVFIGITGPFHFLYGWGAVCFVALLIWQHRIISLKTLHRINAAFAITNGYASLLYGILVCCDLWYYSN